MMSITKSLYLFTFIFAVNLFSVKCVYKRDCEIDCTEEETWPDNIGEEFPYRTPLTSINFFDAEEKDLGAVNCIFNSSSVLKCENNKYEVTCWRENPVLDSGTITGGVLGDEIYNLYEIKIHTSSHPSNSAGSSLGDANVIEGPAILLQLVYVKDGTEFEDALQQRDGFVQFFIGIEVVGVIDNELASAMVAALEQIKTIPEGTEESTTYISVGDFIDPFIDEIVVTSSYVTTVGHLFLDDGDTQTHADASIVIYLAHKACSWVSYKQWVDGFALFEDKSGYPRSLKLPFYEPFDCQPIIQSPGITACRL